MPKTDMAVSGADAVRASKSVREKKEAVSVSDGEKTYSRETSLKKVGAKTFYLENDVWIDSEFKEEAKLAEVKLSFASEEYFDFVAKEKELAQFFSLGEQIIVVWKGKVYRIIK